MFEKLGAEAPLKPRSVFQNTPNSAQGSPVLPGLFPQQGSYDLPLSHSRELNCPTNPTETRSD